MALAEDRSQTGEIVLPLCSEEISVAKRVVPTARVQVSRVSHEQEQLVDELLAREHVEIDRISMNTPVDTMPAVREEGDTIIVPIVEEVLVVEHRLILKEEVRIRRVRDQERHQERVTIRRQEAVIRRLPVEPDTEVNTAGVVAPKVD
jgi:uncharacterized protein (TIGR02271 family)